MIRGDAFLGERIEVIYKGSGDFTDCMDRIVPAMSKDGKSPSDPHAFCAWYEHEQSGSWPGEKRASVKSTDTFLGGTDRAIEFELLYKAWSDEARAAAAEARRNNAGNKLDAATEARAARHITPLGWKRSDNPDPLHDTATHYTHPDRPGERVRLSPSGAWTHDSSAGRVEGSPAEHANYFAHLHGTTQADKPAKPEAAKPERPYPDSAYKTPTEDQRLNLPSRRRDSPFAGPARPLGFI